MKQASGKPYGAPVLLFGLAVLLLLSYAANLAFGPHSQQPFVYQLTEWYRDLGMTGVLVSVAVMIASALTFLPAEAPGIANGAVYGPINGAALSWASGMVGANIGFAIGRMGGTRFLGRFLNEVHLEKVETWIARRGGVSLLIARCIPLFPFFLLNYGAGLTGMRVWTFNWATAIGMVPAATLFALLGDQMGALTLVQGGLILFATLAGIAIVVLLVRRSVDKAQN